MYLSFGSVLSKVWTLTVGSFFAFNGEATFFTASLSFRSRGYPDLVVGCSYASRWPVGPSQPRPAVGPRRSPPQGIDNLHGAFVRVFMAHHAAKAVHEMGRQLSARKPGRMATSRAHHLLCAVPKWRMRPTDDRCQAGHLAPGSAVVTRRPALCLQGLRLCGFGEYHAELA
jgi:hypothetical protein